MYFIATVAGFATYFLLGPVAMWTTVFLAMPVVSAFLISWCLLKINSAPDRSMGEMWITIATWIALSFSFDAVTYVVVVPALSHSPVHWKFFVDQSPWIWLCYAVLIISGYAGRWWYLKRRSPQPV